LKKGKPAGLTALYDADGSSRSACLLLPTDQNKGFRFSANLFQKAANQAAFILSEILLNSWGNCLYVNPSKG
jgi:hypothetical protein